MKPTDQILVTVTVDGVVGEATIDAADARHICGSWGFDEHMGVCPRCEANNRAAQDARRKKEAMK